MRFTFRLRTLFVLASLIAVGLFLWGERQRFFREHVYVRLIDDKTGVQINEFRYRTWIITQQSGLNPEWSEWMDHRSGSPISLKVPQNCRLNLQAQDCAKPVRQEEPSFESMLVAPETSHQWTIRLKPPTKALPLDEERRYSKSDFVDGPCVLSGRVVDEQGNPIPRFGLRVYLQYSYQESYLFEINAPDGRFHLNCPQPIAGYIVQAESFALEQRGFLERTELSMPDTANQTIPLQRGLRLSGTVKLTKEHRKETTLLLIDQRTDKYLFYWNTLNDEEREWSHQIFERKTPFPSDGYVYQYRERPKPTGDFEFQNLSSSTYLLLVYYNDQLLMEKQMSLDLTDIAMEPIVVPPTGSVQGIVQEFAPWRKGPSPASFPTASISPFEIYVLSKMKSNSRRLFRVDQSGRFQLDDILVGQYQVIPHSSLFRSVNNIINPPFVVSEAKLTQANSDYAPILEIEVQNDLESVRNRLDSQYIQAELCGSNGIRTTAWLGAPEATRNGPRRRLYGDRKLPSGRYHLELPNGYLRGKLYSDFDYVQSDRTEVKEVSAHELSFVAPPMVKDVSEHLSCTVSKSGVVVFDMELGAKPQMKCMVEGAGPFDVLIENSSHGWALFRDVKFSRFQVELGEVRWNQGGTIELDLSSTKLAIESIRFELRNKMTGRHYSGDEQDSNWKRERTSFQGLMPGSWVFELFGSESFVGEKLLLSKKIELKAGETILYDGSF